MGQEQGCQDEHQGWCCWNANKVETLDDPVTPVVAIIARVPRQHLMLHYGVATFSDTAEFLAKLAISSGKLKKGGVPDRNLAARIVLQDWNSGKIKYFTHPPETKSESTSQIVQEFSKDFSLEDLESVERMEFSNLPNVRPSEIVQIEGGEICDKAEEMEQMDLEDENDETILPSNVEVFAKKSKKQIHEHKEKEDPLFQLEGNMKLNKLAKLQAKKAKKDARRRDRVAETLANQMDLPFSALTA